MAGGNALVLMTATEDVNANINCNGNVFTAMSVRYELNGPADCNVNGEFDSCELTDAGVAAFVDVLLDNAPFNCIYDFDNNLANDGGDVQGFVEAVLGI
ncbi:MAG: hypothetical protein IPK83_15490 [Planctomycetes bacterium]|nr:hypothetical protein [Planctomycetota bacterium]